MIVKNHFLQKLVRLTFCKREKKKNKIADFGSGLHMVKNGIFQHPTTYTSLKGKFHANHFLIND